MRREREEVDKEKGRREGKGRMNKLVLVLGITMQS